MLKIQKKTSTILSMILSCLFFAGLLVLAAVMPFYIGLILKAKELSDTVTVLLYADAYAVLVLAGIADAFLFRLLRFVRQGDVFTQKSVSAIRAISWCCIAAGILFAILIPWFLLAAAVAFVAAFVGLCLRVVKNAFEEATEIKSENDLTV